MTSQSLVIVEHKKGYYLYIFLRNEIVGYLQPYRLHSESALRLTLKE